MQTGSKRTTTTRQIVIHMWSVGKEIIVVTSIRNARMEKSIRKY